MMASLEPNLEILNLVHQLAALSWNDSPLPLGSERFPLSSASAAHPNNINKIGLNKITVIRSSNAQQIKPKENENNSTATPKRRIQPVSVPIRPPDIQNLTLFPPIGEMDNSSRKTLTSPNNSDKPMVFGTNSSKTNGNDPLLITDPTARKLKQLESKLRGRFDSFENYVSSENPLKKHISILKSEPLKQLPKKEVKKAPRSADLFSELTTEVVKSVDVIAEQYSSLIDNNLCRNVLEEVTFLFQLIASSRSNNTFGTGEKKLNQLTSVAQQVYFVIKVLSLQLEKSLSSIDPRVIQLLVEKYPHRIPKPIRKHFQKWAENQNIKKLNAEISENTTTTTKPSEFHQCVTFRSETDGRSNFPNQGDFHAFCKQRDLFYSIKNLWTEKEDTNISVSNTLKVIPSKIFRNNNNPNVAGRELDPLCAKIKTLFSMNSSCANLSHFASLFTSQFIMDSLEAELKQSEEIVEDDQMRSLQKSNPDRFAKLHSRMSTGSESKGNQRDYLAFQKYFLKAAGCPQFNQHLIDRITYEIAQIEKSLENVGSLQPEETEVLLKKCILLAKLLGYLVFLPYSDDGPSTQRQIVATLEKETILTNQLQLRTYQRPPIDLTSTLSLAIQQKRLTFALPWIIEFLSAGDTVSLQLPSYIEIITFISSIYHTALKVDSPFPICTANKNFLRFWCGNLFGQDKLPVSLMYLKEDENFLTEIAKKFKDENSLTLKEPNKDEDENPLDLYEGFGTRLIGFYFASKFSQMIYTLHVGLQQQPENSLSPGSSSNSLEVKHIRPIPAKSPMKAKPIPDYVNLERQLESSFFDSNPPSVKKTVDFVSDRIASNYVKKLRKTMPEERSRLTLLGIFEEDAALQCRQRMFEEMDEYSKINCMEAVSLLIGDSVSNAALNICQQITTRKCIEKVVEWVENHIKGEMFPTVAIPILPSPSKTNVPEDEESTKENIITFSTMILLHRCQKKMYQRKLVSSENIDEILNATFLGDCPALLNSVIDFSLALVTFLPTTLTTERIEKMISLWRKNWSSECRILSPRNLMMLEEADPETEQESWRKLSEIISRLIQKNMISLETIEQESFGMLRENLSSKTSSNISRLLRNVASSVEGRNSKDDRSAEVIDWIAWYCSDQQDGEF